MGGMSALGGVHVGKPRFMRSSQSLQRSQGPSHQQIYDVVQRKFSDWTSSMKAKSEDPNESYPNLCSQNSIAGEKVLEALDKLTDQQLLELYEQLTSSTSVQSDVRESRENFVKDLFGLDNDHVLTLITDMIQMKLSELKSKLNN